MALCQQPDSSLTSSTCIWVYLGSCCMLIKAESIETKNDPALSPGLNADIFLFVCPQMLIVCGLKLFFVGGGGVASVNGAMPNY